MRPGGSNTCASWISELLLTDWLLCASHVPSFWSELSCVILLFLSRHSILSIQGQNNQALFVHGPSYHKKLDPMGLIHIWSLWWGGESLFSCGREINIWGQDSGLWSLASCSKVGSACNLASVKSFDNCPLSQHVIITSREILRQNYWIRLLWILIKTPWEITNCFKTEAHKTFSVNW